MARGRQNGFQMSRRRCSFYRRKRCEQSFPIAASKLREFAYGAAGCGFQWRFPNVGCLQVERDIAASMGGFGTVGASMLSRMLRLPVAVSAHGAFAGGASGCGFRLGLRDVDCCLVEHDVAVAMSVSVFRMHHRLSEAMWLQVRVSRRCSFPGCAERCSFQ